MGGLALLGIQLCLGGRSSACHACCRSWSWCKSQRVDGVGQGARTLPWCGCYRCCHHVYGSSSNFQIVLPMRRGSGWGLVACVAAAIATTVATATIVVATTTAIVAAATVPIATAATAKNGPARPVGGMGVDVGIGWQAEAGWLQSPDTASEFVPA
jgi:hypothetical protein